MAANFYIEPPNNIIGTITTFVLSYTWLVVVIGVILVVIIWRRTIMQKFGFDPRWRQTRQLDEVIELEKEELEVEKTK